jgi:hypothetical protein
MKTRILTAVGLALALSACSTYRYVDDGGGYYRGRAATTVHSYDYYYPGASFGLGYGYYGYGDPVYRSHRYRNPYYLPPRYPQVVPHGPQRPQQGPRPPQVLTPPTPPHSDRAPWRDLERLRDSHDPDAVPRADRRGPVGTGGGRGPRPEGSLQRAPLPRTGTEPRPQPRMEPRPQRSERPMGRNVRKPTNPG